MAMNPRARNKSGMDAAKRNKNDEFYTQLSDIEAELRHYRHERALRDREGDQGDLQWGCLRGALAG